MILLICIPLLGGCATLGIEQSSPPVTVSEVIQMSKEGVPTDTILDKMRESQLSELRDQGVADQVIDYIQQTYLYVVRHDQRFADWDYWNLGADGFWYGRAYYGWPPHWWIRDYGYSERRDGGGRGDQDGGHEAEGHGEHGGHGGGR